MLGREMGTCEYTTNKQQHMTRWNAWVMFTTKHHGKQSVTAENDENSSATEKHDEKSSVTAKHDVKRCHSNA